MSKPFDWVAPRATTEQVIELLPGTSSKVISQWMQRGALLLESVGHGGVRLWSAIDIMQAQTLWEITRMGLTLETGKAVFLHVQEGVLAWPYPHEVSLLIRPTNPALMRQFREDVPDDDPQWGARMDDPGAPPCFLVFRISRMLRRAVGLLEGMEPVLQPRGRPRKAT